MTRTAVALMALALAVQAPAQAQTRIRLGTLAPQGTSYHRTLTEMGERWRAGTSGQVQLTVYAGTMGSEVELVRRMRLGQLQAAALTATGIQAIDPAVAGLQEMPMVFRSLDEAQYVREKLEPVLAARLADKGFIALFWADGGWVQFFTRDSVVHPDELKKEKVFVTAGETQQFDIMKSVGYFPVALEWTDVLTALQTHMIDAVPTIPYFALTLQVNTTAKYMLRLNWLPVVGALLINKRTFDALTPEQQGVLRQAALEAGRQFQIHGRVEADQAVDAMRKRGLTVIEMTPAAQAEWRALSERLYPKVRGGMVPADIFDQVMRYVAEYRAAHQVKP
jgi:TRAP-type transport system periplasmic protein